MASRRIGQITQLYKYWPTSGGKSLFFRRKCKRENPRESLLPFFSSDLRLPPQVYSSRQTRSKSYFRHYNSAFARTESPLPRKLGDLARRIGKSHLSLGFLFQFDNLISRSSSVKFYSQFVAFESNISGHFIVWVLIGHVGNLHWTRSYTSHNSAIAALSKSSLWRRACLRRSRNGDNGV